MYLIFFLFGAGLTTFLHSRAALWLLRKWSGGTGKLLTAHAATLLFCWINVLMSAFAEQRPGPEAALELMIYVFFQGLWLTIDWHSGLRREEQAPLNDVFD
jgi:uncharacterized membrane protein